MELPGIRIDLDSEVPVYRQIADAVRAAALRGELGPGHRLPPTRDLARRLGVNRNTVVAAYETLGEEGWVRSHTGRGTFLLSRPEVAREPSSAAGPRSETWFTAFSRAVDPTALGGLGTIFSMVVDPEGIPFVGSYPAGELIPVEPFRGAIDRVLAERGAELLTYGPTNGYPALRETIAEEMRRSATPVREEEILVTNGAQEGLELIFRTFVERGDAVVLEEPTYTGALGALGTLGGRPVSVPVDEEGMRTDLLAIALERHRPRLIYVQPTFHNPTTRVMSEARRRELLALALRYRCPIVEDDWAGGLRFEGRDLPTLFSLDGGQHVIYVGTFSKKLMPGLRLGWLAAPPVALERLVELKRIQDCGSSPLLQAALDAFLRQGGLEEHLERVRPVYRERRDCMLRALERHFPGEAQWSRPSGGLFLWVRLPSGIDGNDLFLAAQREGVLYSRGELFHSDGRGRDTLRLTYSAAREEQIETGIRVLGRLIRERRPGKGAPAAEAVDPMPIF